MRRLLLVLVLLVIGPTAASAQMEARRWSVQTGIGFTADPESFLLGFEADYRLTPAFSVGGDLQLGLDGDFIILSPTAHLRYGFDLSRMGASETLYRLTPYLQTGVGFTYINVDVPDIPGFDIDDDDIGFLMNFGFGGDYRLTESLSVGSKMLFNVMPTNVFGESFYFSWEVAGLRYHF